MMRCCLSSVEFVDGKMILYTCTGSGKGEAGRGAGGGREPTAPRVSRRTVSPARNTRSVPPCDGEAARIKTINVSRFSCRWKLWGQLFVSLNMYICSRLCIHTMLFSNVCQEMIYVISKQPKLHEPCYAICHIYFLPCK